MTTFKDYINQVTDLIGNTITNLLLTAAVAAFMFAVVSFIWKRANGSSGDGIKDARNQLGWSIVALFVMFSIWGIISFLQSGIFGSGGAKTQIEAPSIKVNTSVSSNSGNPSQSNPSANTSMGNQVAPGAQSNVACPSGQFYDARVPGCVGSRGGAQVSTQITCSTGAVVSDQSDCKFTKTCDKYNKSTCPSSYCKLDYYDFCIRK